MANKSKTKKTSELIRHIDAICIPSGPLRHHITSLLSVLLFVFVIIFSSVMLLRPIDTTYWFDCPDIESSFIEPKTYYREIIGEKQAYYKAINDVPTYASIRAGEPPSCTKHSFSLYLF